MNVERPLTCVIQGSYFYQNGGTSDYTYGQEDAIELAQTTPDDAIANADNYEVSLPFFLPSIKLSESKKCTDFDIVILSTSRKTTPFSPNTSHPIGFHVYAAVL